MNPFGQIASIALHCRCLNAVFLNAKHEIVTVVQIVRHRKEEKGMFFLGFTTSLILFITGGILLARELYVPGGISFGLAVLLVAFLMNHYHSKRRKREGHYQHTNLQSNSKKNRWDCDFTPDCTPDCDTPDCDMPDCDCSPDCSL